MVRLIVLIILLTLTATCVGVVGAHATVTQSGLDPDVVEDILVGLSCILVASYAIVAAVLLWLMHQIILSQQIILGSFSIVGETPSTERPIRYFLAYFKA
ncbi:MAG: hypothetical protein Q7J73_02380 [Dehalococcoidales bacterium]|nr:hypothetical protein [Dehalococcoidales bacterium]